MHSTQSCPDLFKIKLPKTNKKTNIGLSRCPALGCCLLLAGVPHCHLFITSLSQPDSSNPVDTRASAEVALAISAYHKTFSFPRPPLKYQGSWERERDCRGLDCLSFPSPLSLRWHGDVRYRLTTGAYEKLQHWQALSPLRLSQSTGWRRNTNGFLSLFR